MRVDKGGFFLYWIDQNNEIDILDIATIRDVRSGQYARKPKVMRKSVQLMENVWCNKLCVIFFNRILNYGK